MAFDAKKIQAKASALMAQLGSKATFKRLTQATPLTKPEMTTLGTAYGTFGKSSSTTMVTQQPNDGAITTNSRVFYVQGDIKFVPMVGDIVTINTIGYRVVQVEQYQPANTSIAFKVTLT